jgi:hypothetical protein
MASSLSPERATIGSFWVGLATFGLGLVALPGFSWWLGRPATFWLWGALLVMAAAIVGLALHVARLRAEVSRVASARYLVIGDVADLPLPAIVDGSVLEGEIVPTWILTREVHGGEVRLVPRMGWRLR